MISVQNWNRLVVSAEYQANNGALTQVPWTSLRTALQAQLATGSAVDFDVIIEKVAVWANRVSSDPTVPVGLVDVPRISLGLQYPFITSGSNEAFTYTVEDRGTLVRPATCGIRATLPPVTILAANTGNYATVRTNATTALPVAFTMYTYLRYKTGDTLPAPGRISLPPSVDRCSRQPQGTDVSCQPTGESVLVSTVHPDDTGNRLQPGSPPPRQWIGSGGVTGQQVDPPGILNPRCAQCLANTGLVPRGQ